MNEQTVKICECEGCSQVAWSITTVGNVYKSVCFTHYFMINA